MIGQFDSGEGREDEEKVIGAGNGHEREDAGLANLEGLSLEELGAMAAREIGEGRQLQAEAVGLSRRSTATFYRAGRALWGARKKLKGKGRRAWTKWQKAHGIPVTSAWQAIRLYEVAEGEEAVAGLTRTQALKKYGNDLVELLIDAVQRLVQDGIAVHAVLIDGVFHRVCRRDSRGDTGIGVVCRGDAAGDVQNIALRVIF